MYKIEFWAYNLGLKSYFKNLLDKLLKNDFVRS